MTKIYTKFNNWQDQLFKRKGKNKTFIKCLFTALLFSVSVFTNAQLLINPATDGGFENGVTFANNGWTAVNSSTNMWVLGTTPAWFTGSRGAFITNNTSTNAWAYTSSTAYRSHIYKDVAFPAGASAVNLSFDWRGNGNDGNWDNLLVYIVNTTINPTTAGPIDNNTTTTGWTGYTDGTTGYYLLQRNGTSAPATTTRVDYSLTASQLAYVSGSTKRLVFVWKNDDSGGSNPPASIDNISLVAVVPSCFAPTSLVATATSATSANLSWTAPSTAPGLGYQWEIRTSGAGGSGATGLAVSGNTAAGVLAVSTSVLTANTTYNLYVRSNCDGTDFSTWTGPRNFSTPLSCFPPASLVATATSATSANLSWTAPSTAPGLGYQWEIRTSGAGGSGAAGLAVSGNTAAGVLAASTSVLTANTAYRLYVRSNCDGTDFSTWTGPRNFSTPLSCFPPTAVTGTITSSTTANLSWTAPATAPSTGYQWEVRTSGLGGSGATGLIDSGSTSTGTITAVTTLLVSSSTYKLYVRSNCGGGDFSTWSVSASSFSTPCNPYTVPYFEGFETGYTDQVAATGCLSPLSITGDQVWTANSTLTDYNRTPRTGSYNAYLKWSNEDWLFIPISLTAGTSYTFSCYARQDGTTATDSNILVRYGTTNTVAGMTSSIVDATGLVNGNYQLISGTLVPTASGTYYIGIKGYMNGTPFYISLDDIRVALTPTDTPDYVSLQFPGSSTVNASTATTVYGQIYEAGLTNVEPGLSGQATGVEAWVGVSPIGQNTNPNTWTTWTSATFNTASTGNNDEYQASIGATLPPGTYYYATRFRLNGGPYVYGGINAAGNGNFWDGTTFNNGVLTINPIPSDLCSNPITLVPGTNYTASNLNASTSAETPSPTCSFAAATSKDIWFAVLVPANVTKLNIETTASSPAGITDTAINAYRGTCGALVNIECDDDDGVDNYSLLNLTGLIPGETILIRAWGHNGATGSFNIKASVPACGTETRWNGTAWSNGTPVAGIAAVINGNYSGTGFTACSLDVLGTSQAVITSGGNLLIDGLVNVASTATLILESNANLVQATAVTNTGSVIIKRESAQLVRLDHTLWSSPVASQNLFAFSPNTLTNRFYTYATPTNTYVNTGLSGTTTFAKAKGYAVRAPNNHSETPATWLGTFTGVPNNGNATFTLVTTGTGFNLVGNPYPSVVDAALFTTGNPTITGTLYFYAHTLRMNSTGTFPAGTNYALWNASGSTAATLGTSGVPALVPNGKIQVGQGFLVKSATAGNVVFTNAMREGSNANQFFRNNNTTNAEIERHRIWLNLTNDEGTAFNQILIAYVEGATQGVDSQFDGLSFGNEGSALSSKLENADYTIQGRALPFTQNDVVSLGFKAITAGSYTISLSTMDGLFSQNQDVYLKDNSNGSLNNLKIADYTFVSDAGTFDDRFQIVYQRALGTPESAFNSNSVIAYTKNSLLNVQTRGSAMKAVSVFDVRGRLLFQETGIDNTDFVISGLSAQNQVLLLQVTSENDEVATIKVIF